MFDIRPKNGSLLEIGRVQKLALRALDKMAITPPFPDTIDWVPLNLGVQ